MRTLQLPVEKFEMEFESDPAVELGTTTAEAAFLAVVSKQRNSELLFIHSAIRSERRFAPEFAWNFRLTAP